MSLESKLVTSPTTRLTRTRQSAASLCFGEPANANGDAVEKPISADFSAKFFIPETSPLTVYIVNQND